MMMLLCCPATKRFSIILSLALFFFFFPFFSALFLLFTYTLASIQSLFILKVREYIPLACNDADDYVYTDDSILYLLTSPHNKTDISPHSPNEEAWYVLKEMIF